MIYHKLLQEYIDVHQNHEETRCSYISTSSINLCDKTWTNLNASNNTTTNAFNASMARNSNITMSAEQINEITDTNITILNDNKNLNPCFTNASVPNTNWNSSMCSILNDSSLIPCRTNVSVPNVNILKCSGGRNVECKLLSVTYKKGSHIIKANIYKSYKHYTKTNSHCSIYGCDLMNFGSNLLEEMNSLSDNFKCFYDKKNTSTVFMKKESLMGLTVWLTLCSFLLLLGTFPFVACICSKIRTPYQGYFQYCTKRYTSRQEKWIDAIKQGNIFILRWSMSQKHINEQLVEDWYQTGFKWRAVPLARAAFSGQSRMAGYLLSRGAFPNYEDSLKLTPLHYACLGAQVNTMQYLIAEGANVEAADSCRRTPLLTALMLNISVPDIIQCLLEAGADVSVEDRQRCTPLHYACFKGDLNLVQIIIKAACISNNTIYLTKETFYSSLQKTPFGSNFGFKTDLYTNTWTPLTSLLYRNSKETCRLLVSAGYDLKHDPILPRVLYSDADEAMNRYIKQQMREVASLKRMCRIWIRKYLGTKKLQQKISGLKLVFSLREYLRLERID